MPKRTPDKLVSVDHTPVNYGPLGVDPSLNDHLIAMDIAIGLGGSGSGVSDHGGLTGLTDNDHPQYFHKSTENSDVIPEGGTNLFLTGTERLQISSANTHTGRTDNPHSVTKSQVGLSNVDNLQQIPLTQKAVAGGVASLDGSGKVPLSQIPSGIGGGLTYQGTWNADTNTPTIVDSTGTEGHFYRVSVAGTSDIDGTTSWDVGDDIVFNGTIWEKIPASVAVASVFGRTGTVVATASDYDADQVDFTPAGNIISTDVQAAIEELDTKKAATGHTHATYAAIDGSTPFTGNVTPNATNTYNFGSVSKVWNIIYARYDYKGDGAVGTPSYTFIGDTTTGWYRLGSGNVAYSSGGTKVLDISSSGLRLGVSTRVAAVLDEDNMISNSATALITQQSAKAYMDAIESAKPNTGDVLLRDGSQNMLGAFGLMAYPTLGLPSGSAGDVVYDSDTNEIKYHDGSIWNALGISGGGVTTVFGRSGVVVAATSDYNATQIDFTPAGGIAATNVQAAIEELDTEKAATSHVHTTGDITAGTFADARIAETNVTQHQAAIDHGSISGLGDDDHTIYSLANGTRAFTGVVAGITPTSGAHLVTKDYVDNLFAGRKYENPVLDRDLTTPPGGPTTGDRYIVNSVATGAWSGQEEKIAEWDGSSWDFTIPSDGTTVWLEDEDILLHYDAAHPGGSWITIGGGTSDHGSLTGLGDDDHTQYHTDSRALTWLGTRTTDDLPEGSNLYTTAGNVQGVGALMDSEFSGTHAGVMVRTGAATYSVIKHNVSASVPPTTTDDSTSDYSVGSTWIDTTADKAYVCLDTTAASAVWTEITQSGGGGDHGGLTGLTDDDHTQYLLADGSRAMTGPIQVPSSSTNSTPQFTITGDTTTGFNMIPGYILVSLGGVRVAEWSASRFLFNKVIDVPDGTSASTAIGFALDADVGLYRPTNNTLGIAAGGLAATFSQSGLRLLGSGATVGEFSTDGTMSGNSNTAVPTEKAVVTFVDSRIDPEDIVLLDHMFSISDIHANGVEIRTDVINWNSAVTSASTTATMTPSPLVDSNCAGVAQMMSTTDGVNAGFVGYSSDQLMMDMSDDFTLEIRVYFDGAAYTRLFRFGFDVAPGSYTHGISFGSADGTNFTGYQYTSHISGSNQTQSMGAFTSDTWYVLRVKWDAATETATWYVDGVNKGTTTTTMEASTANVLNWTVYSTVDDEGDMLIDYVKVLRNY